MYFDNTIFVFNDRTIHLPNIISVSRRTDIPAFFSSWFKKRLTDGFVVVRNPYNSKQMKIVSLKAEDIFCFVFWTKNPMPLLDFYSSLLKYPHYFLITITGYGKDIEPNVPEKDFLLSAIKKIYNYGLSSHAIVWRYDPIIIADQFSFKWHYNNFESLASVLSDYIDTCIISFVDAYNPKMSVWDPLSNFSVNEIYNFAADLAAIAKKYNITLQTCSEVLNLDEIAIKHGACIDIARIVQVRHLQGFLNKNEIMNDSMYQESLFHKESMYQVHNEFYNNSFLQKKFQKDKNQRKACMCARSIDIGTYHTCGHGCKYCYAKGKLKPFPQPENSQCLGANYYSICH